VVKYLVVDRNCSPAPLCIQFNATPYDLAYKFGHKEIADYLQSKGGGPSGGELITAGIRQKALPSSVYCEKGYH